MAPVGLAQASLKGEVVLVTAALAPLLMPLLRDDRRPIDLFTALQSIASHLRQVTDVNDSHGQAARRGRRRHLTNLLTAST